MDDGWWMHGAPQDCWLESKAAVSVSVASQTHRSTGFFLGGHGRAPPFLYHGGALSLYPAPLVPLGQLSLGSENGQVAILPTGDMEAQVTPEMHEMHEKWGQWW